MSGQRLLGQFNGGKEDTDPYQMRIITVIMISIFSDLFFPMVTNFLPWRQLVLVTPSYAPALNQRVLTHLNLYGYILLRALEDIFSVYQQKLHKVRHSSIYNTTTRLIF